MTEITNTSPEVNLQFRSALWGSKTLPRDIEPPISAHAAAWLRILGSHDNLAAHRR